MLFEICCAYYTGCLGICVYMCATTDVIEILTYDMDIFVKKKGISCIELGRLNKVDGERSEIEDSKEIEDWEMI